MYASAGIVFIFGLLFGSFLNVCIYRLPRQGSIIFPASHCPNCKHNIRWFDNIPLLSFLALGGKCRYCKTPINFRYPLVELLTGLLFLYAFIFHIGHLDSLGKESIINFIISVYLISTLIIITFIDFEFQIIPDEISISGIFIALILSGIFPHLLEPVPLAKNMSPVLGSVLSALVGAVTGGGIIYLVGVLGKLVFRKEAMGFGDVKLMAMLGGILGWEAIIYVFFIGCFLGAIVGGISWFITRKHYLPFGPYLALGVLVMRFFAPSVVNFAMETYPRFIRNLFLV
jgi:leader peptidase (prepilin peptidase)/N-methyltransferase